MISQTGPIFWRWRWLRRVNPQWWAKLRGRKLRGSRRPDVFDAFRLVTEHLAPELFRRGSYHGIWTDMIAREDDKDAGDGKEKGLTLSTFSIGRSEPEEAKR